jgi:dihydroxyacid dehydratase/phosphogluconate dehydratase
VVPDDGARGPARVYNSEEEATKAIMDNVIKAGDVVVIRYSGPGARNARYSHLPPLSREWDWTSRWPNYRQRFPGYSRLFYRACFPEPPAGPIAAVKDGDIKIDILIINLRSSYPIKR